MNWELFVMLTTADDDAFTAKWKTLRKGERQKMAKLAEGILDAVGTQLPTATSDRLLIMSGATAARDTTLRRIDIAVRVIQVAPGDVAVRVIVRDDGIIKHKDWQLSMPSAMVGLCQFLSTLH